MAHTLLLLETAYHRIGERIRALSDDLDILAMDGAGAFRLNGAPHKAAIDPTLAWMGLDLYRCPQAAKFSAAVTDAANLAWVQTALAGVEAPIYRGLLKRGVRLCSSDAQAPSIADFIVGCVLGHFQQYARRLALQADKVWQPVEFRELSSTHWLIIGYGSIGQEVARRVSAFGAKVTGVRRTQSTSEWADVIHPDQLSAILPQADVVVLACALTDETRYMVDADFLAALKANSTLVNVGRGALVVDDDLLAALDAGTVEHAILDVFDPEPLPDSHPYWQHPRVLATSHGASFGDGMAARGDQLFLDNLARLLAGEPLHKEVPPVA